MDMSISSVMLYKRGERERKVVGKTCHIATVIHPKGQY